MQSQPPIAAPTRTRHKAKRKNPSSTEPLAAGEAKRSARPASSPALLSPEGAKRLIEAIFRVLRSL
jgi:hypothetical protein